MKEQGTLTALSMIQITLEQVSRMKASDASIKAAVSVIEGQCRCIREFEDLGDGEIELTIEELRELSRG